MNIVELIKRIDNKEVEFLFKDKVTLSNGNIVNFDAYSVIDSTASYINIENSIYVVDYQECEYGVDCIFGEEKSIHLEAIAKKLDIYN